MDLLFLFIGLIIGGIISWIISSLLVRLKMVPKNEFDYLTQKSSLINTELEVAKQKINSLQEQLAELRNENDVRIKQFEDLNKQIHFNERTISTFSANLDAADESKNNLLKDLQQCKIELKDKNEEFNELNKK